MKIMAFILLVALLIGSLSMNVYLVKKKPVTLTETVYQNKLVYITKTITNQSAWTYIDELNLYRTNAFVVTNSADNTTVRLVDRFVNIRLKKPQNEIGITFFLDGFGADYKRRIFDTPFYIGPAIDVRGQNIKIGLTGSFIF